MGCGEGDVTLPTIETTQSVLDRTQSRRCRYTYGGKWSDIGWKVGSPLCDCCFPSDRGSKVIARGRGAGVWRREKEYYKSGKVNGLDVISFPGKIMDLVDAHGQELKETS